MPEFHELLHGYRRFRTDGYPKQKARYDKLVDEGQLAVDLFPDVRRDRAVVSLLGPLERELAEPVLLRSSARSDRSRLARRWRSKT